MDKSDFVTGVTDYVNDENKNANKDISKSELTTFLKKYEEKRGGNGFVTEVRFSDGGLNADNSDATSFGGVSNESDPTTRDELESGSMNKQELISKVMQTRILQNQTIGKFARKEINGRGVDVTGVFTGIRIVVRDNGYTVYSHPQEVEQTG